METEDQNPYPKVPSPLRERACPGPRSGGDDSEKPQEYFPLLIMGMRKRCRMHDPGHENGLVSG